MSAAKSAADELTHTLNQLAERLAHDHKKKFRLQLAGLASIPRPYVPTLKDVLIQMLRNSAVHGIETVDVRRAHTKEDVGAVRIDDYKYRFIDQPNGWLGEKTHVDIPYLTNLRLDPFERQGWPNHGTKEGAQQYFDWFKFQFWRFVFVQQVVAKFGESFVEFPPMQKSASFNLDAIKEQVVKAVAGKAGS